MTKKPPEGGFFELQRHLVESDGDRYGAAPDERFLAVRAGDSRDWNLVDFLMYLIRYL